MAEQELDRNEAATPFKLQKAREQGQTARSADLVAAVALVCGMAWLTAHGLSLAEDMLRLARAALLRAGSATDAALWPLVAQLATAAAASVLPLFLAMGVAAIAAAVAQTGMVFSLEPLQVDFRRLDPAQGLQRLLSLRTLFDTGRACLKLAVLTTVAVSGLLALLPQFHAIAALPPAGFLKVLVADATGLGLQMAGALVAIALLDALYTRAEFARRMRMSRRELKDEFKQREGDPRIRSRMRELRREMLRRSQAVQNTRDADVVLTNPTHYAVALRYVHGEMDAPCVIAKGAGQLAAAMRAIAARHNVIVVQNPPLARRLFREAALDAAIPPAFHAEVARIIVWVLAVRRQAARAAGAAG